MAGAHGASLFKQFHRINAQRPGRFVQVTLDLHVVAQPLSRSILVRNRKQPLVVRIDQNDLLALVDALFSAIRICTGVRSGGRTSARTTFVRKPSAYDGLASSRNLAWGQHDSRNN